MPAGSDFCSKVNWAHAEGPTRRLIQSNPNLEKNSLLMDLEQVIEIMSSA